MHLRFIFILACTPLYAKQHSQHHTVKISLGSEEIASLKNLSTIVNQDNIPQEVRVVSKYPLSSVQASNLIKGITLSQTQAGFKKKKWILDFTKSQETFFELLPFRNQYPVLFGALLASPFIACSLYACSKPEHFKSNIDMVKAFFTNTFKSGLKA